MALRARRIWQVGTFSDGSTQSAWNRSGRIVITDLYTYKLTDTQIYTPTNFSTASVLPTVYEVGL